MLGVERPPPAQADGEQNAHVFEHAATFYNPDATNSPGRIDLYKRGCFVPEVNRAAAGGYKNKCARMGVFTGG